jgi:hypothetical protein
LAPYPWHQTSDFSHDIELARGFARSICFQANESDGAFAHEFKNREQSLIELCNELANTKMMPEFIVRNENFYENIFGTENIGEGSESDSSMDEGESELMTDSESSNS